MSVQAARTLTDVYSAPERGCRSAWTTGGKSGKTCARASWPRKPPRWCRKGGPPVGTAEKKRADLFKQYEAQVEHLNKEIKAHLQKWAGFQEKVQLAQYKLVSPSS